MPEAPWLPSRLCNQKFRCIGIQGTASQILCCTPSLAISPRTGYRHLTSQLPGQLKRQVLCLQRVRSKLQHNRPRQATFPRFSMLLLRIATTPSSSWQHTGQSLPARWDNKKTTQRNASNSSKWLLLQLGRKLLTPHQACCPLQEGSLDPRSCSTQAKTLGGPS